MLFRQFIDSDTVLHNYSTVLHIILWLQLICDDVAFCPLNIKSLLPSDALEGISLNILELKISFAEEILSLNLSFSFSQLHHSKDIDLLMDEDFAIMYQSYCQISKLLQTFCGFQCRINIYKKDLSLSLILL
jgi:hypothetical protein